MNTHTKLHIVSLVVIAILGSCLAYKIVEVHRGIKFFDQYVLERSVQTYQSLDRGDIVALKEDMGAIVVVQSRSYERDYAHETDAKFAPVLADAKVIRDKIAPK